MLTFILGRPASGKTYTIINKIKELTAEGQSAVLIVPEQFTFESERAVLKALGDKAALNVSVLSFSRLCDEIGDLNGGNAGKILADADKVIFMHRALKAVENELKLWGKYTSNVAFSNTMLDTIGEFKINAISPEDLRNIAKDISSPTLQSKLHDIALIYETYDMLMGERFIDPADRLTKLYRDLQDSDYFCKKNVFLDSFKGFTGQQYRIMERIFSKAENVYISLTDNPALHKEYSIYTNIRTAADRIKKLAKNHSVTISEPVVLEKSRYKSENLSKLEQLLAFGETEKCENDGAVNICYAATAFDEADFAARTIRRLVRTEGYRYRDFVIIARDLNLYEEAVTSACTKNGVSYFYDRRIPLSFLPFSVAAMSAIDSLKLSTESILRFHKSTMGTLSPDEISELENYTYLWNIDGKTWLDNWEMDVRGFVTDENESEEDIKRLNKINDLRKTAIAQLIKFRESFFGNAGNMARAIVTLFEDCSVPQKLADMCHKFTDESLPFTEDVLRQGYDMYMSILDSLVISFADASIDTESFTSALKIAVDKTDIGVIPQCLDQVTFGSADRIRPSRPKIAFILGANQGIFPKVAANSGVFNILERKNLIESGLTIADNSVYSSIDEEYLVYCNLCCASERLYISSFSGGLSGEKSESAAFIDTIKENLDCNIYYEPMPCLCDDNIPETTDTAFTEFCRRIGNNQSSANAISEAIKVTEKYSKTRVINSMLSSEEKSLSRDIAKRLYGKDLYMSATKFDTFNRCKFSYFCRYGLKAQKLQPADFDVLQRGTIVHYVLERIVSEHGKAICNMQQNELGILTDKYIDEYLDRVKGFRSVETARTRFLVTRVSRSLKEVVFHLADEFRQTDFTPTACELKIGFDGIPLEFPFDDGKVKISGSIDRMDEYSGYIRIVDYKTGSKTFKLPDILFGLNLQMLIYLYAVVRGRNLPDETAAAILYMPSRRDTNDNGMAMNGLLLSDSEIVHAMDKQMEGEFVPKLKFNKDGSLSKSNNSFIESVQFSEIFDHIERLMRRTGNSILKGDISINPTDGRDSAACKYCDFASVCRFEDGEPFKVPNMSNADVFSALKGDEA